MPRMGTSKQSLEGAPPLPAGDYYFRVDGFKPKKSKKGDSINFNPTLKVINNPAGLNDSLIFFNLNSTAGWIMKDFVHSLGLQMEVEGDDAFLPGNFIDDPNNPDDVSKAKYEGPMLGRTGRVTIAARRDDKGKDQSFIKMFYCVVPNCTEKHSTDLK